MASRLMANQETIIVAVDILPVRRLGPNVITLIGDITTDSCKAEIRQNLQGSAVDVVLHDGAPNIGASYDKDAYEQNEIALHALKCATQHLKKDGHFITKLYRSRDYASYVWIAKQFFKEVQAVKPAASRSQSAEIFLVCQNYLAPAKIDPRMLDPKHVFEAIEGDTTGGGNATKNFNVFHKSWDAKKRPNRHGYDMDELDFSMRKVLSIRDFMEGRPGDEGTAGMGPIEILSNCTGMAFACHVCKKDAKDEDKADGCDCKFYLNHKATTPEIKACVSDLKVLNKSDFKGLLVWRTKVLDALKEEQEQNQKGDDDDDKSVSDAEEGDKNEVDSEEEEDKIQSEIAAMRQRRLRQKKKVKKKERTQAAKRRRRAAFGMDLNAIDVPDHDALFTLATITSKGELEAAREVDLDKVTHAEIFGASDDENESDVESQGDKEELDEDTGYNYRLDRDLDGAYDTYLKSTKDGMAKSGTKMAKRSKKVVREKAMRDAAEDEEMLWMAPTAKGISHDTKTYSKLLSGARDSDDSDDDVDEDDVDEDSDGFNEEPLTPGEHAAKLKKKKPFEAPPTNKSTNPLIHKLEEPKSAKTARWFSNPLFESIGNTASLAAMSTGKRGKKTSEDDDNADFDSDEEDEDDDMEVEDIGDEDDEVAAEEKGKRKKPASNKRKTDLDVDEDEEESQTTKKQKPNSKKKAGLDAEEVFASMPKTDKQLRHEKRIKAIAREERRQTRKARKAGGDLEGNPGDFEVAAAEEEMDDIEQLEGLSKEKKAKILEARALIKAGLGMTTDDGKDTGFEVVSAAESRNSGRPLPIVDQRKYDSENEDYDSEDYTQTLALGTMMLRQSKAKALVDASYNRFAWNDPGELPDWFVDDENRHYRPQLPIPQALIDKINAKQLALSAKPIAKVAEARARKGKRAKLKMVAAKKKAEVVAQSSEMSEAMKLKAISKAMRGKDAQNSGKSYVVARKGGSNKGGKGFTVVDKRLKSDKRATERIEKKKKKGKQNGLTGGKKRRNHK